PTPAELLAGAISVADHVATTCREGYVPAPVPLEVAAAAREIRGTRLNLANVGIRERFVSLTRVMEIVRPSQSVLDRSRTEATIRLEMPDVELHVSSFYDLGLLM